MLAAARPDIEQVIGRADDLFFVLDYEQRIAFVAQVMHHAHQLADIARVQSDARFVHDKKRVHERRPQTSGQINALHFPAAQCARRAIECEVTNTDFAEIIQSRTDFVPQHSRGRIVRSGSCRIDPAQQIARIGNGKGLKVGQR